MDLDEEKVSKNSQQEFHFFVHLVMITSPRYIKTAIDWLETFPLCTKIKCISKKLFLRCTNM
ncbi:MAG TPA: hypothetical protein DDZ41_03670, partial [Flavobacterium sp.]|nr:hypothetical protein [Flavobacterium sp.]